MTRALQSSSPEYLQASRALLRGRVACHQHLPLLSPGPMGTRSKAEPALALAEAHSPCAVRRGPCRALGSTAHPHRAWPRRHHGLRRRGRQAPWEPAPPRSRPRAAVRGAATCAPPSACHEPLRVSGAVRHRHIRHGTGRRPLRSASRAPRKPKPRKVNAGRRCPPGPAPGTRPAKQRERAGQVRARLLGGRGGLGLHAPGPRGRQRGQAAERALARLVTATPSAHATATDGRGSVCESLALKLGCQGQRASVSTARSLLRAACGPCRHC